jgi:hypothetical protein
VRPHPAFPLPGGDVASAWDSRSCDHFARNLLVGVHAQSAFLDARGPEGDSPIFDAKIGTVPMSVDCWSTESCISENWTMSRPAATPAGIAEIPLEVVGHWHTANNVTAQAGAAAARYGGRRLYPSGTGAICDRSAHRHRGLYEARCWGERSPQVTSEHCWQASSGTRAHVRTGS